MHNRLSPEKAKRLREIKQSANNSILLDSGDAIWAGNVLVRPFGEPVLKLMNTAGYDAMAMGNREFHFAQSGFRAKIGWADFPVLCANVSARNGENLPVLSHILLNHADLRIAVFGLCVPMITEKTFGRLASPYVFGKPVECAAELAPTLRRKADIVIALTHIGIARDRELSAKVDGIDLIIGGHTHIEVNEPGRAPIFHSGWYAKNVGKVVYDTDAGLMSWELMALA
jgi:2',3'-cyclic-nucleotide 2'-phosphodiesterase (5'-nucleotidase family)